MSLFTMAGSTILNLFKKPATLMYPLKPAKVFKYTRGHVEIDYPECIFCSMCQRKCPTDAITVDKAAKSWKIERLKCISCGSCIEVCPKKCLAMPNQHNGVYSAAEKFDSIKVEKGA